MSWLTRVGQALSGEIVFEYESTVEPVSGKRQRRFHHSIPAAWAAIILIVAMPGSILAAQAAFADPGPGSPSLERPDDRGDDMGRGQGRGTDQGGPDGQGTGRGNGSTTTQPGDGSSSTSTVTNTSTSTVPGSGSTTTFTPTTPTCVCSP